MTTPDVRGHSSDRLLQAPVTGGPLPGAVYEAAAFEPPDAGLFDVKELFSVVRRNAWLIVLPGVLCLLGTYVLVSRQPVRYQAEALVRVRDAQADITGGLVSEDDAPRSTTAGGAGLLSELMVLTGRQVAGAVVDSAGFRIFDSGLGVPAPFVSDARITLPAGEARQIAVTFDSSGIAATGDDGRRAQARYGAPLDLAGVRFTILQRPRDPEALLFVVPRETAVDWVRDALTARTIDGTDAIRISAISPSASLSTLLANATVEQYQSANAARARERNRRRREFLEARLRETDDSLVSAQTALGRFRTRTGVYGAREQFEAERSGATEAERQRKQLLAEQRIRRALLAEMNRSPTPAQSPAFRTLLASGDIAANPMVSQLATRLAELAIRRDELLAAGRPADHPEVAQTQTVLASTEERLLDAIRSQVNSFDTRVAALLDVREQAAAEVSRLTPTEAEEVRLNEQVEAMREIGSQLRLELQRTRLAEAAEMGQVEIVDRANRALPLRRGRPLKLALAALFGLFFGTMIVLVRDHLDTGLHRRIEVERALRVPGLAIIPQLPRAVNGRRFLSTRRAAVTSGNDLAAEAFRALRTRLLFAPRSGAALRSVVVTSAWAGEGKTTTAANLAVTLAQQGMRVLLVDCDLRRPRLHALFGATNKVGLADVLLGRGSLSQVMQLTRFDRLSLLSSGGIHDSSKGPSELLGDESMKALLASASQQFDITVLDTPPVLLASDASILAARSDSALVVLRAGRTNRALVQDAMRELSAVGANVVGVVLNDPDAKTVRYQEYSIAYGH